MSGFNCLASSKKIELPNEISSYYERRIYEEPNAAFSLRYSAALDEFELAPLRKILKMPYIYYVDGLGDAHFWLYLARYMEAGNVLEVISIPQHSQVEHFIQQMLKSQEPIEINLTSFTYKNHQDTYKLDPDNWVEELKHRELVTNRGVTTIVK